MIFLKSHFIVKVAKETFFKMCHLYAISETLKNIK